MAIMIFLIIALIMSAVVHEVAHGAMAYRLGDSTAKDLGRLTLNPLKHLDPFGSIILPLGLLLLNSRFFLAWAKPVPYNPFRLRDRRFGDLKVALAGPAANVLLALIFGLTARWLPLAPAIKWQLTSQFLSGQNEALLASLSGSFLASIFVLAFLTCFINLMLAIFNLIPIPPLDGSKIILTMLPAARREIFYRLEAYGLIILVILLSLNLLDFIWPLLLLALGKIIGL